MKCFLKCFKFRASLAVALPSLLFELVGLPYSQTLQHWKATASHRNHLLCRNPLISTQCWKCNWKLWLPSKPAEHDTNATDCTQKDLFYLENLRSLYPHPSFLTSHAHPQLLVATFLRSLKWDLSPSLLIISPQGFCYTVSNLIEYRCCIGCLTLYFCTVSTKLCIILFSTSTIFISSTRIVQITFRLFEVWRTTTRSCFTQRTNLLLDKVKTHNLDVKSLEVTKKYFLR